MSAPPVALQTDITDCGPTSLFMICEYYDLQIPLDVIRKLCSKSRVGTSLLGLSEAAEALGFTAIGAKLNIKDLTEEVPMPSILYLQNDHFVVLTNVKRGKYFINDPAFGKRKLSRKDFLAEWSSGGTSEDGVGLFLVPSQLEQSQAHRDDDARNREQTKSTFALVVKRLSAHKKLLLQVLLGLVIGSCLQLAFPFLTQGIVDTGIRNSNLNYIYLILFAQLFIYVGITLTNTIRSVILMHISARANVQLLSDFFKKLFKLPISYYDNKVTGDVLQRVQDHSRLELFLTTGTLNIVFSLFNIILFSAVLGYYNINILLIFLAGSFLFVGWIALFMQKRAEIDFHRFRQMSENSDKLLEILDGMPDIKLNGNETRKRWEWEYLQAKIFKVNLSGLNVENWQTNGSQLINELKNIIITVYTASLVIEGEITLGMMLAIAFILGQINAPLSQLNNFIKLYQDAKLSLIRINETYRKEEEYQAPDALQPSYEESIALNNVSFRYNTTKLSPYVLNNISLEIPKNKVTAIVGSSGSGKSTLMKLLLKFYEPESGTIKMGHTRLDAVDNREWRANIGVVLQDGFIFNDTIGNNITLSSGEAPNHYEMVQAAKQANIHEHVSMLPLQYDTKIGNTGQSLSAGQTQRILIARAIYKKPKILFFDEATSALDSKNESEITNNLQKTFLGKTVVIIAHRLSTVRNADKIVVLEKGNIMETGDHKSLVDKKGIYYNLVKNQLVLN